MTGKVKHIVIVQSLKNERLTGTELYEDCIRRKIDYKGLDFTHRLYCLESKAELTDLMNYYAQDVDRYKEGLALHLEIHGDEAQKGLILASGELITWKELVELCRPINVGTHNNLYITMATCFGRYIYMGVDPYEKSPYAAFISASIKVSTEQVADDFFRLYDNLLDNGNLINAYLDMEKGGTEFYYKDSKVTFEEAFESVMEQLHGDMNLKAQIVSDARKQAFEFTGTEFTEAEGEMVFNMALKDMFMKQYNAFKFD